MSPFHYSNYSVLLIFSVCRVYVSVLYNMKAVQGHQNACKIYNDGQLDKHSKEKTRFNQSPASVW